MNAQLHQALGIIEGRAWSEQDQAILREAELARENARLQSRAARRAR